MAAMSSTKATHMAMNESCTCVISIENHQSNFGRIDACEFSGSASTYYI